MRIVCAGAAARIYRETCIKYDCSKLFSFFHEAGYIRKWNNVCWLMVDSGAHSWNKLTITKIGHSPSAELPEINPYLRKYAEMMLELRDQPYTWVEFDVYGHLPKAEIDAQYETFTSIVGKDKFMRVYHPMIDGGTLKELEKWIAEGQKYIGIGNDSIPLLPQIFSRTRDKIKIHGFAMTKFDLCERFPFYSVDSTSPLASMMYGTVPTGNMGNAAKDAIIKRRDPRMFRTPEENMIDGIKKIKETEKYLTELWKRRGVVWHD